MAVKDTLPSTNLTWDDIRDTLNAGGGSVTNDVASAFKSSAKINKWSRNKPYSHENIFDLTDSEKKAIKWGLSPIKVEIDKYTTNSDWNYNIPKDGEPKRVGDFRGYCSKVVHNYVLENPKIYIDINNVIPFATEYPYSNFSAYRIPFNDLRYSDYFLGLAIRFATKKSEDEDYDAPIDYLCKTAQASGTDFTFNGSDGRFPAHERQTEL